MAKRTYRCNATCHHEGCNETTHWNCESREAYLQIENKYARNWMCQRHKNPEEVLSVVTPTIMFEVASIRSNSGCYWGNKGFVHGPGFMAWCNDFPEGTILRVVAEIILPDSQGQA